MPKKSQINEYSDKYMNHPSMNYAKQRRELQSMQRTTRGMLSYRLNLDTVVLPHAFHHTF